MRRALTTLLFGFAFALPFTADAFDDVEWRAWNGRLPAGAIRGGVDDNGRIPLFICRAHYRNGIHPGKLREGRCNIGWGGEEIVLRRFEVLVSTDRHYREPDRRHRGDGRR